MRRCRRRKRQAKTGLAVGGSCERLGQVVGRVGGARGVNQGDGVILEVLAKKEVLRGQVAGTMADLLGGTSEKADRGLGVAVEGGGALRKTDEVKKLAKVEEGPGGLVQREELCLSSGLCDRGLTPGGPCDGLASEKNDETGGRSGGAGAVRVAGVAEAAELELFGGHSVEARAEMRRRSSVRDESVKVVHMDGGRRRGDGRELLQGVGEVRTRGQKVLCRSEEAAKPGVS